MLTNGKPVETLNEYQDAARRTWDGGEFGPDNRTEFQLNEPLVYLALGIAGESGELVDKIKKLKRGQEINAKAVAAELGDVLWYVSTLAHELGFDLDEIADMNLRKLADRQARNVIASEGDNR